MCHRIGTTVYRYFTSLFVCLCICLLSIKLPECKCYFTYFINYHMINPRVILGVIMMILKYSISRIVDPKVENDTSS